MNIRDELFPQDPTQRIAFCIWLVERCAHFWPNLVIGDEASFQINARVCILHHCTLCDELISMIAIRLPLMIAIKDCHSVFGN